MRNRSAIVGLFFIIISFTITGCSTWSNINLEYKIIDESVMKKDLAIYVDFKDGREVKEVFGPEAKSKMVKFTGKYALFVKSGSEGMRLVGEYDLPGAFNAAFEQRFKRAGMTLVADRKNADAVLEIVLKNFSLNIADKKWVAKVTYEAQLNQHNRPGSRLTINAEKERIKIVGRKEADRLISGLFDEAVNRLDINKLF